MDVLGSIFTGSRNWMSHHVLTAENPQMMQSMSCSGVADGRGSATYWKCKWKNRSTQIT
ncbi:hypothetical protein FWK35_00023425 [Aphis craccivora]|uniref:Uncharacterized protein n=1 Tax=Aphis craccivora TaxID=307492 RepID=A0A6G0YKJ7_APHCR|nr:hypothetical protein FWK35_00023425 [Aphis craccivora]